MFEYRITPADAGKTAMFTFADADVMDHPRGCGENQGESMDAIAGRGSPPRMRGKRYAPRSGMLRMRITPADAGKTRIFGEKELPAKDHPRGCGENQAESLRR